MTHDSTTALRALADTVEMASRRFSKLGSLRDFHYDETPADFAIALEAIVDSIRSEGAISDYQFGQLFFIFYGCSAWMDFVGDEGVQASVVAQLREVDNRLLGGVAFDRHRSRLYGANADDG